MKGVEAEMGVYKDPGLNSSQELSTKSEIDPLDDRYWSPIAMASVDLVEMSRSVEEVADANRRANRLRHIVSRGRHDSHDQDVDRYRDFVGRYLGPARVIPREILAAEGDELPANLPI
ncbi:MAG TPA: hypothetical protein VLF79_01025 [Candidatus Saccharimonadales bacterium]|nr:hypothetical protein [Candidatus Saccharimonadales bacterium]